MAKPKKNNKKKIAPVKPVTVRRTDVNKTEAKKVVEKLEPADVKLARKITTDKTFRDKLTTGFLKGITFGLYNP